MTVTQQPSREAFVAYWKDFGVFRWRQILEYIAFLGGLAAYVFVVRTFDPDGRFLIVSLIVAVAYLVLVPYLTIRRVHTRFARFIRCPHCGDWFGQDASGAYFGPNPKYRAVIETGRCFKCGTQILSDYGVAA
jgi:CelD/BcsL family acetyltransferase involved in cellulose biosynthesis